MKGIICVDCGKEATKGSYKHPYCKSCFEERFDSYVEYSNFLNTTHPF